LIANRTLATLASISLLRIHRARPSLSKNQLGKSDHDHLGKLLTYLSAMEAKTAIWIVGEPRPEHVKAAGWLNESGLARFLPREAQGGSDWRGIIRTAHAADHRIERGDTEAGRRRRNSLGGIIPIIAFEWFT